MKNPTPKKRFGQHFLTDQGVLQRIASACVRGKPGRIMEIGPGPGALTALLLDAVAHISVVELDRDLAAALPDRFADKSLTVHQMDILNCQLADLDSDFMAGAGPYRIVGNLPYNISTPLIFHLLDQVEWIEQMVFMVQDEVAKRLSATPGSKQYGRLSVMTALKLETEYLFSVPPEAFDPPPKVTSAVIKMTPLDVSLTPSAEKCEHIGKIVTAAFAQRRKTLRNALGKVATIEEIEAAGVDPSKRAETLSPEDYVRLSEVISNSERAKVSCPS